MKLTKKRKVANKKVESGKIYPIHEASSIIKEINTTKFDSSIDLHINLGIDPKKADQALRGTVALPHGTGKTKRVLVLCGPEHEEEAKNAGADFYGLDEYMQKIEQGWTDVDVIIATPMVMPKIAKLGRILGPRNLMPNPKSGTVTPEIAKAVSEVKKGKISFRVDKLGAIHTSIGRVSFNAQQIEENAKELIHTLSKMKPSTAKGIYFKSIYLSSTMSPGLQIDVKTVSAV